MSGTAYPHLHPAVRGLADEDDAARIAHIRAKRWVEHRPASVLLETLDEVFDQPSSERMENLLILGESGMGKTALVHAFERRHAVPWDEAHGVQSMPPSIAGPASSERREVAFRVLREVGTRVLVLDEINSVLAGTPRQQRLFLQLLRFVSNELRVALVCTGVPEARHALMSDAQLRGRFAEVELAAWTAGADLQDLVNRVVQGFPLRQPSPVDGAKVRRLLVERSGGITLRIYRALERAAIAAVRDRTERVCLEGLQDGAVWRGMPAAGAMANRGIGAAAQRAR